MAQRWCVFCGDPMPPTPDLVVDMGAAAGDEVDICGHCAAERDHDARKIIKEVGSRRRQRHALMKAICTSPYGGDA